MEATQRTHNNQSPVSQAEPVYLENTLLRVFGVLFCHDPKRARQRTGTLVINRGVKEKAVAVRLDPESWGDSRPSPRSLLVRRSRRCTAACADGEVAFQAQPAISLTTSTMLRRSLASLICVNAFMSASPSVVARKSDT